jgi:N-acetylmuramoyl-L-alanine amidase
MARRLRWATVAFVTILVFGCLARMATGQQLAGQPAGPASQFSVVIDAAHGGSDTGAHLSEKLEEKDLVLDLSVQLRSTLSAHGIQVTTTREIDVNLPARRRAEIANHRRPAACILLHATASGQGVHLYTSSLPPETDKKFLPWDTAQSAYVESSLRLSSMINSALTHAQVPVTIGRTSLLPLDNLTCPAVAVEIAPLGKVGDLPTPLTDVGYQKQVMSAVVAALEQWEHDWSTQR